MKKYLICAIVFSSYSSPLRIKVDGEVCKISKWINFTFQSEKALHLKQLERDGLSIAIAMIQKPVGSIEYLKQLFGADWECKSLHVGVLILDQFTRNDNQAGLWVLSKIFKSTQQKALNITSKLDNFEVVTEYNVLFANGDRQGLQARLEMQYPSISEGFRFYLSQPEALISKTSIKKSQLNELDEFSKKMYKFENTLINFNNSGINRAWLQNAKEKLKELEESKKLLDNEFNVLQKEFTKDVDVINQISSIELKFKGEIFDRYTKVAQALSDHLMRISRGEKEITSEDIQLGINEDNEKLYKLCLIFFEDLKKEIEKLQNDKAEFVLHEKRKTLTSLHLVNEYMGTLKGREITPELKEKAEILDRKIQEMHKNYENAIQNNNVQNFDLVSSITSVFNFVNSSLGINHYQKISNDIESEVTSQNKKN